MTHVGQHSAGRIFRLEKGSAEELGSERRAADTGTVVDRDSSTPGAAQEWRGLGYLGQIVPSASHSASRMSM
jgi:hypothetical protein